MQRASWRLSKILRSSSRVIPFYTWEHRRAKGEKPVTLTVLPPKRASRKETVHLSEMTSAVPTCSPKDLCSKGESLSRSLSRGSRFRRTRTNSVATCVRSSSSLARRIPKSGMDGGGYSLSQVLYRPRSTTAWGNNIRKDVSRLKNSGIARI